MHHNRDISANSSALPTQSIPGPRGRELLRALHALPSRPHDFLLELALRYGPIVCMPFPLEAVIILTDADAIERVFHHNHRNYTKQTGGYRALAEIMGNGLFSVDGDDWRRHRQRVQPAFHADRLGHFEEAVRSELAELRGRWRALGVAGTAVSLYPEMLRVSLPTIVKAMFGSNIRNVVDPALKAFADAHTFINPMSLVNLVDPPRAIRRLLAPGFRAFEQSLRVLHEIIQQIIAERTREGVDRGDVLSMLIAAQGDDSGEPMTPTEVRDQVMTMFMAGHETVALGLTWALYLLSMAPTVRRDLQAEIRSVLGARDVTLQDLSHLNLTRMVIDETLRLYPPAWGVDRRAMQDDVLAGYRIPAGARIGIPISVIHRLPRYWVNPDGFDPARFETDQTAGRPQYAYLPFGGGPRRCVGMRFALVQMQMTLATIVQQFDVDLVPGQHVVPQPRLNLSPTTALMATLRNRTSAE